MSLSFQGTDLAIGKLESSFCMCFGCEGDKGKPFAGPCKQDRGMSTVLFAGKKVAGSNEGRLPRGLTIFLAGYGDLPR